MMLFSNNKKSLLLILIILLTFLLNSCASKKQKPKNPEYTPDQLRSFSDEKIKSIVFKEWRWERISSYTQKNITKEVARRFFNMSSNECYFLLGLHNEYPDTLEKIIEDCIPIYSMKFYVNEHRQYADDGLPELFGYREIYEYHDPFKFYRKAVLNKTLKRNQKIDEVKNGKYILSYQSKKIFSGSTFLEIQNYNDFKFDVTWTIENVIRDNMIANCNESYTERHWVNEFGEIINRKSLKLGTKCFIYEEIPEPKNMWWISRKNELTYINGEFHATYKRID